MIRRAPAGYLVHSGRVVVRAVEVHHINIRSAGLRTPAGPRPPAGSGEWWPKELASRMAISRVLEGNIRDRHQAPQLLQSDTPDGPPSVEGRTCGRRPQAAGNRRPSWLTSDHYFEAELERPIRRQVVAGPRFEPAKSEGPDFRYRGDWCGLSAIPIGGIPLSHRVSPSGIPTPDIRVGSSRVRLSSGLRALAPAKATREHWRQRGTCQ
jgi:hypothetical protein